MMEEFDRLAWENYQELAPRQKIGPGKAIVFAITKHHAARLAQYLNELHPEHKGRYAEVITCDVADAGRRYPPVQDTRPIRMVAVSVGMLDTGFDCREVLHLVMCRRVRSPILYQQMRGRGTRTAPHIGKRSSSSTTSFGTTSTSTTATRTLHRHGRRHAPWHLRPPPSRRVNSWSSASRTSGSKR